MDNRSYRVLVVDDDALARQEFTHLLENHGYKTRHADNGHDAVEMLRGENYDLVVLDLLMPGVDGFEVLGSIKADAALKGLPVMVVTSADDSGGEERCAELGAVAYLRKPVDHQAFVDRVGSVLDGSSQGDK